MKYLLFIIISCLLFSCSPVRKDYYVKSKDGEEKAENPENVEEKAYTGVSSALSDTTYISLPPIYIENNTRIEANKPINHELDSAVRAFNDGEYDSACNKLAVLQETLKEEDSLYYEAVFYNSECLIVKNEYNLAENLLENLLNEDLNSSVEQRVWLRLGHIKCALEDKEQAAEYFERLKEVYPKSIYKNLANCSSLK